MQEPTPVLAHRACSRWQIGQIDLVRVSRPVEITLSDNGLAFAESAHAAGFEMASRADPFHKIVYVVEGEVVVELQRGDRASTLTLTPGSVLLVSARQRHAIRDRAPATLMLLCLSPRAVLTIEGWKQLWQILTTLPRAHLHTSGGTRQRIERLWRSALLEQLADRAGHRVMQTAIAAQMLVLLARLPRSASPDDLATRVRQLATEIEETFYDAWNIDRAAQRVGTSRRTLTTKFRAVTGQTFWDFLTTRRLDHAARLLTAAEHSLAGVVFACGFSDVSHFYRLFRARFGATPGAWTKRPSQP